MRYKLPYILLLLLLCTDCSVQKRIQKADKRMAIGEYYEAAMAYKKVYPKIKSDKKKLRAEVAFKEGECFRYINHPKAPMAYATAIRQKYQQQDSIVFLRQAQVLHYQGKYSDALKAYNQYLEAHPYDQEAQMGAYACSQIEEWKKQFSRYKVKQVKAFDGRRSSSYAPCFIGNSDALMFTSNRIVGKKKDKKKSPVTGEPLGQLFTIKKNASGDWDEAELTEGLYDNAESSEKETAAQDSTGAGGKGGTAEMGVCCFSQDGRTMYFTYSKPINGQDQGAHIYTSSRASGSWADPQELKLFPDSSITVGHPALNPQGDTLWFASDAPGGFGGKDLWFSVLDGSDWSFPQNAGPFINTAGDELYPAIRADGTLYFASNGHAGYGGLDLYKAIPDTMVRDKDSIEVQSYQVWNLGKPFNSNGDDFGITFEGETENGYFSSNRGDKKGYDHIYRFDLPEMVFMLEGSVSNTQGEPISVARLRLVGDDGTNAKIQVHRDGTYRVKLQKDVHYALLVTSRGYLNAKETLHTDGLKDSKTFTQDFVLTSLAKPVKMDNVFYEFGKWDLTPASSTALDGLVKLLQDNPNITIELSAHTDMVGNAQANKTLSEKRAQSVVNYLIQKGIPQARLTPVGYGKEQPVTADEALHKQHAFIPVDQVLDEAFILTLPKDQQEICNQINRRTEFKVLSTTYGLY